MKKCVYTHLTMGVIFALLQSNLDALNAPASSALLSKIRLSVCKRHEVNFLTQVQLTTVEPELLACFERLVTASQALANGFLDRQSIPTLVLKDRRVPAHAGALIVAFHTFR